MKKHKLLASDHLLYRQIEDTLENAYLHRVDLGLHTRDLFESIWTELYASLEEVLARSLGDNYE